MNFLHSASRYDAGMSAARCPRCATNTLVPGRDVHVCTGCGGVWLDAEHSHRLLAPLGADLQRAVHPQTAPIGCPTCGTAMHTCVTRLAGVEIDVCAPHGAWFDRHELEHISAAVSRISGQPMPHAPAAWSQAQAPAAAAGGAMAGAGVAGTGLAVGAAAVGVAAAGAVAYSALSGDGAESGSRSNFDGTDALTYGPDVVNTGVEVSDAAGDVGSLMGDGAQAAGDAASSVADVAGDVASGAVEVGADAAEAAGSVLGGIFEAIGSIFS